MLRKYLVSIASSRFVARLGKASNSLRLTDEQAAEIRRRLADPDPKTMTLAEFNERLRSRYGV